MYSKSTYRPRRTRIYGANYDIGESYYKGALDSLDNKSKTIRFADTNTEPSDIPYLKREDRASTEAAFPKFTTRANFFDDDEINSSFRAGTEEPLLKGSLKKYRDLQQDASSSIRDDVFNNYKPLKSLTTNKYQNRDDDEFKSLFEDSTATKRISNEGYTKKSINQRIKSITVDEDYVDSSATLRAKATKARLANLESEMMEISDKQNEREKRNLNLKKLLMDSNMDDIHLKKDLL